MPTNPTVFPSCPKTHVLRTCSWLYDVGRLLSLIGSVKGILRASKADGETRQGQENGSMQRSLPSDTSLDHKLHARGLDRVRMPLVPDPSLCCVAAPYKGPEELPGVVGRRADDAAIHQPLNPYRPHVFG